MTTQPVPDDLEAARSRIVQAFSKLLALESEDFGTNAAYQAEKADLFRATSAVILAELSAIREAARRPLVEALEEAVVYADASRRRMAERNDVFSDGQAATWEQHSYILRQIIERFTE